VSLLDGLAVRQLDAKNSCVLAVVSKSERKVPCCGWPDMLAIQADLRFWKGLSPDKRALRDPASQKVCGVCGRQAAEQRRKTQSCLKRGPSVQHQRAFPDRTEFSS
jgi:hypothetical protein